MRLFERAAVRAALPLRWGRGFNPRPRLSLPLPRPTGSASQDELLVLDLEDVPAAGPDELLDRLRAQMPRQGLRLLAVQRLGALPRPRSVRYRLDLPAEAAVGLPEAIRRLMAQGEHVVQRRIEGRPGKSVDIRPYLERLNWDEQTGRLTMTFAVTPAGTVRPAEALSALGLDGERWLCKVVREWVDWQVEQRVETGPATARVAGPQDA